MIFGFYLLYIHIFIFIFYLDLSSFYTFIKEKKIQQLGLFYHKDITGGKGGRRWYDATKGKLL